jgi:hypothetical protein
MQGITLAKQALYLLSHTSSSFSLVILKTGSRELLSWAGLELQFSQFQPSK